MKLPQVRPEPHQSADNLGTAKLPMLKQDFWKPLGMQASIFGACPSQNKNWEGCARKGIRHKNGGDGRHKRGSTSGWVERCHAS